ncbi:hypothetical protein BZA05DRAFT_386671 [Tricharina praecox]|uniref:uncharacterized protein n=1 Tax=Tricharina praecox TaxID=43433 RepID=UPI002220DFB9|nr:uncharacterized protein BZA05DRAFT_386671 [Tricharina praecox]KAI5856925.1 hypothetical protein BZA05DRAFT_386671 [Tricharina praecox]
MSSTDEVRIPPALLQRLITEFMEDKKTRISQPAVDALGEYFRTFIREAIWRAAQSRKGDEDDEVGGRVVGGGTLFLEVRAMCGGRKGRDEC